MKAILKTKEFLLGVRAELRKVTWVKWKELVLSTSVVVFTVVIVAAFLGIIDHLMQLGLISGQYSILNIFR